MTKPAVDRIYDVVVIGGRCAGAATAMLLARRGLRVLVLDRGREGSDTLSTHALMRGAVLQLKRWGILDQVRAAGTPAVRTTSFHYGGAAHHVEIKPKAGVDALYAPRRSLLDGLLVRAARDAGACVVHRVGVTGLVRDSTGRVCGVLTNGGAGVPDRISAQLVIGADGVGSATARRVGAYNLRSASHTTATLYAYWEGLPVTGNQWYYAPGVSAGAIPTNSGRTNVFVSLPPARLRVARTDLEALYQEVLGEAAPSLSAALRGGRRIGKLFPFSGVTGFLRRSHGPGWALVGDAGYFKDPITAHGITDAFRDAELLALAAARGTEAALADYQATRDELSVELFGITNRIASFAWDLEEVQELHKALSRCMNREVEALTALAAGDHVVLATSA